MSSPQRITRSRKKGSTTPPNTVYVGRGTKWGNPYRIVSVGEETFNVVWINDYDFKLLVAFALPKDMAVKLAIDKYREGINQEAIDIIKKELQGKNLSCWCKPGEPCHADVLLEIANKKL